MKIAVIDGQGGGIGKALVERLRTDLTDSDEIIALGTNALATAAMLKAGAHMGATGENAVVFNVPQADVIVGSIGIVAANAMLGELTPNMATAISSSPAIKILIPLSRCNLQVAGVKNQSLPEFISDAVTAIKNIKKNI